MRNLTWPLHALLFPSRRFDAEIADGEDRVIVEADSPYLSPVPLRGKRNEPAHVVHTAACLAGLLGIDVERLAEQTTSNARQLFPLPRVA